MSMPISAMRCSTAAGGAAPPVMAWTRCVNDRRAAAGALAIMFMTIGAPHIWVTPVIGDRIVDRSGLDAS